MEGYIENYIIHGRIIFDGTLLKGELVGSVPDIVRLALQYSTTKKRLEGYVAALVADNDVHIKSQQFITHG
jgi:hypothetical protein